MSLRSPNPNQSVMPPKPKQEVMLLLHVVAAVGSAHGKPVAFPTVLAGDSLVSVFASYVLNRQSM